MEKWRIAAQRSVRIRRTWRPVLGGQRSAATGRDDFRVRCDPRLGAAEAGHDDRLCACQLKLIESLVLIRRIALAAVGNPNCGEPTEVSIVE
jgi:hypothetical protein